MGLDIGMFGLGLRGLTPVFKDGKHLGSVEFGMSFDNTFFEDFKKKYGVDLVMELFKGDTLEPFASTMKNPPKLLPEDIEAIRKGEAFATQETLEDTPIGIYHAPVRDYANEVVGALQIVMDRSKYVSEMAEVRNTSLLAALVSILIGLGISFLIARSITRPLDHAVDVTQLITEGKYNNDIQVDREDEAGQVLLAMQTMQSRLNYDVHTVQEALTENQRVRLLADKCADGTANRPADGCAEGSK